MVNFKKKVEDNAVCCVNKPQNCMRIFWERGGVHVIGLSEKPNPLIIMPAIASSIVISDRWSGNILVINPFSDL